MRRKDREITDIERILQIMDKCDVCRLAFFDENYPYMIPLNFGYNYNSKMKEIDLYFHGATQGKKLEIIKRNNHAAFEMDCSTRLIKEKNPCDYTMEFESVCGNGSMKILSDEEKLDGLKYIMKQYSDNNYNDEDFDKKILKSTVVFKLKVNEISGKILKT